MAQNDAIHICPAAGSDAAPGTVGRPLATLTAALRTRRQRQGPATVLLHGGVHRLEEPLVLTTADNDTTIAAAPEAMVVISGGRLLAGLRWQAYRDGIQVAEVPTDLVTDQLFVNGESLPMARYPHWRPWEPGLRFNGTASDALDPERVARWADPTGGIVHAMHEAEWGCIKWTITGKQPDGSLRLEGGWQINRPSPMHPRHRMVENIFEELDAPGDWYHDRNQHRLYLYPMPGTDLATATVEAIRLKHLVELRGSLLDPVRGVVLRGIIFRHAARTFMETRESLTRSDWAIYRGGALFFTGTADCAVEDCCLNQVGGNGIFASGYNRRLAVRRTEVDRAGASAVAFVGLPQAVRSAGFTYNDILPADQLDLTPGPATDDYPADCFVEDCLLTRFGQTEKQCAGVQIQMAARITVRQCSIYDCPRAGINIGDGCWGGHLIEGNDVFDTVKETGDHGCFNAWGRDRYWHPRIGDASSDADPQRDSINKRVASHPGLERLDAVGTTVLRRNRWRYDQDHRWGWDVDLDDGSSNYLIEDNLCLNHGIKLREGFHRTVRNNVCIHSGMHAHCWPDQSDDVVTGNIFCSG